MTYRPYADYQTTCRTGVKNNSLLLLSAGIGLTVVASVFFVIMLSGMALHNIPDPARQSPLMVLLALMSLGGLGLGTVVAAQMLQRRSLLTLLGPKQAMLRQFLRVSALLAVLLSVTTWLTVPRPVLPGLEFGTWLALLPLTIGALLVQTGSEELFFRGYLQSQLAARFAHPVIWIGLPSVLFGALHYAPSVYGSNAAVAAVWAMLFGLATADVTARAGTLGPALAMHLANNFVVFAIISMDGQFSGLSIWVLGFGPGDEELLRQFLPLDLLGILLAWLSARLAIRA